METERLLIRPFKVNDVESAYQIFEGHPDVWRYDPGYPHSLEQRREEIFYRIRQYQRQGFGCMAVTLKADGTLIGYCGLQLYLWSHEPLSTPEMELFYKLGRDYWGQGYATEASRAMIDHAFHTLRVPRLVTWTAQANANSIALMERLGFALAPSPTEPDYLVGILENPTASKAP